MRGKHGGKRLLFFDFETGFDEKMCMLFPFQPKPSFRKDSVYLDHLNINQITSNDSLFAESLKKVK